MPYKAVKCSINIHRVSLCYFTGSCQGTGSTGLLTSSGPCERHDITLPSWLSPKTETCVLLGGPATSRIIALLSLRVPLWSGALTLPLGTQHLQEQPNHWLRNFFRSWLTAAANLDNRQRAPIKALTIDLTAGTEDFNINPQVEKNYPLRKEQHFCSMHYITQPYYTLFIIHRCIF